MIKIIYNYHPKTGEFVSESVADVSPLESTVFLIPAFATDLKPSVAAINEVSTFVGGNWQITADWRGVPLFSVIDGRTVAITEIGEIPTDVGATDVPQPSPAHSWRAGTWVLDQVKVTAQLDTAKANGLTRISDYAKSKRALIAGTSDDAEIAGWNNKLRIALAYQATTATAAEVLAMQVEIDSRGLNESVDVFVGKVLANAAFYAQAVGLIDGLKRRAQDAVSAADSPEAVEVVLTQMRSQAEAAFVQLMAAAI